MTIHKYSPNDYPIEKEGIPSRFLESIFTVENGKQELGRIALFQNPSLDENAFSAGCFQAKADFEISQKLLAAAVEAAQKRGAKKLIGPMNGSTWENYRFAENSEQSQFFTEPTQPDFYQKHWEQFGFRKTDEYFSSISECFDFSEKEEKILDEKFRKEGIRMENFDLKNLDKSLRELAIFNNAAFAENDFFSPILEADFVKKYQQILPMLDPELIFLAKAGDKTVGLVFNFPDLKNSSEKTLISKTIAHLPGENYRGLVLWMYIKMLRIAKQKGYQKIIHALMKSNNFSVKRSEQFGGKIFRKYWLYAFKI